MKKIILLIVAAIVAGFSVQAKTADEFRIYLNPGHGSYGANDRPMKTIGHPNTGVLNAEGTTWIDTDTLGFYEGRGTLPRAFGIGSYLKSVGVKSENIVYSRLTTGPWPYTPHRRTPMRLPMERAPTTRSSFIVATIQVLPVMLVTMVLA